MSKGEEIYKKAKELLEYDIPEDNVKAAQLLHNYLSSKDSDLDEDFRWKGRCAFELGCVYYYGVDDNKLHKENGKFYSEVFVLEDQLLAYEYFKLAAKYHCYNGITFIASIYRRLLDYNNEAKMLAYIVKCHFLCVEDAQKRLYELIEEGHITGIPEVTDLPFQNTL